MNKFHVNIATNDEPYNAKIYCQNILRANRILDGPNNNNNKDSSPLTYTVTGISFADNDDDDTTLSPSDSPSDSPTINSSSCKDSTKKFKWNKNKKTNKIKRKTCKWLSRKKSNPKIIKKLCKKKKQGQKVWIWCPKTCGNVGLGACKT